MTVAGIALSTYEAGGLSKVPDVLDRNPDRTFDLAARLGDAYAEWAIDRYGEPADVPKISATTSRIPMNLYRSLSLDELCKVRFSCTFMMQRCVEDAFEAEPRLAIYQKIVNGMWRWGCGRPTWNEIVDAYDAIRGFDMGIPGFEVTLDHTTSTNESGCGEHSRTYLDGVFGYLVHYRGEHVMTLGFSIMEGRRVLLQQVQLKSRRGNRWLFRLPRNYLEHVIDRFRDSFPGHGLFLVDGHDVIGRSLSSYRSELARAEEFQAETEQRLRKAADQDTAYYERRMVSRAAEIERLRKAVAHAEPEVERLGAFYASTGRYRRGEAVTVNRLRHYAIAA